MINYEKFRSFFTSNGSLVIAGKNAEQNEEVIEDYIDKDNIILHTKEPGSPFCIIKIVTNKEKDKISAQDIKEAAIFCACFSQQWKKKAKEVEVHAFKPEQIFKEKKQKTGTFTVLGKVQKAKVKLQLGIAINPAIKNIEKNRKNVNELMAVPIETLKKQKIKPLIILKPGKIEKKDAALKIQLLLVKKYKIGVSLDNILRIIPAGGFSIK